MLNTPNLNREGKDMNMNETWPTAQMWTKDKSEQEQDLIHFKKCENVQYMMQKCGPNIKMNHYAIMKHYKNRVKWSNFKIGSNLTQKW